MSRKKKEKIKRILVGVCAGIIALALVSSILLQPVLAVNKDELSGAKEKTAQAKENVEAAEKKKAEAIAAYEAIDKQIADTEHEIEVIESQIAVTESEIKEKEKELEKAEKEYDEYMELFKVRARTMYENSELDYLEIIFSAKSFGDFLSKMDIVSSLMKYDQSILDKMEEAKQKIIKAKEELNGILEGQKANMESLTESKAALDKVLLEKQNLVTEFTNDVEKYKAIYEAAEAAEQALIKQYEKELSYEANPVEYSGGQFAWPVPSTTRITSKYGYRIHPVYGTKKFHSGIDIGASYGVDIVAAADGTVTLATYNGGYGKCVIINHGSGITTLYGHNSSLLVSKGQKVTKGQVIAKAGSTGVSTGPHLHYEVRKNGATTDPMSYY